MLPPEYLVTFSGVVIVTVSSLQPLISKKGDTQTAITSLMNSPGTLMEPSNVHLTSSVELKHGPDKKIAVPPSILPTRGDVRSGPIVV